MLILIVYIFVGIMDKKHERHQEKYGWVENKTQEAAIMMIEAAKRDDDGNSQSFAIFTYHRLTPYFFRSLSCTANLELHST